MVAAALAAVAWVVAPWVAADSAVSRAAQAAAVASQREQWVVQWAKAWTVPVARVAVVWAKAVTAEEGQAVGVRVGGAAAMEAVVGSAAVRVAAQAWSQGPKAATMAQKAKEEAGMVAAAGEAGVQVGVVVAEA